ncbi:HAMP domain-containing sensor histidine kinase [uncultured Cytophaga sp.]|uniref:sensor histidine kinase n=1 Tax=uncultured Cytophaga sp. TaxID=160238 RepID=UPI0026280EDD|nr:HAMP domain-containing sensor histidine kinase [uncultured Cytophaga sp.]
MRLHNYTLLYISIALFFIIGVWASIFYIQMLDEIYDSIDDTLGNNKALIIKKSKTDTTILYKSDFEESNYSIKKIDAASAKKMKDVYVDTLMYMANEDDMEIVRLLKTVFTINHVDYYELNVISSMVEEDDLMEDLFYSLFWLYGILLVSIFTVNTLVLRKVWKPFYSLIQQLEHFNITKSAFVAPQTKVHEFKLLNKSIESLLKKNSELYISQKQFIENASHELQTPLAISINKLELLSEKNDLTEADMILLTAAIENLQRLTRLNKSLLLLSKIENKQYADETTVAVSSICKRLSEDFEDLAEFKNIQISFEKQADLNIQINADLAEILCSNIIKNAIVHTDNGGFVTISVKQHSILIENSGDKALDSEKVFQRFYKNATKKNNTGLGLAIVKSIADKYGFELRYSFMDKHRIEIIFSK